MRPVWQSPVCFLVILFSAGLLTSGCVSRSEAKLREKNAYLEGQNAILQQQQAQSAAQNAQNAQIIQNAAQTGQSPGQSAGVMIIGSVQNPQVPWVTGLTLAQAINSANYVGADEPKQIIITRNGESATMDASVLLNGTDVPLQAGDVVELR